MQKKAERIGECGKLRMTQRKKEKIEKTKQKKKGKDKWECISLTQKICIIQIRGKSRN